MNPRLYLLSTLLIVLFSYSGFVFGINKGLDYLLVLFNVRGTLGFDGFALGIYAVAIGLVTGFIGVLTSIIILHKLSKRYFVGVAFGRTVLLSLFTTFLLLFLYLLFFPQ